jgi:glyoxylase-like metal-dependent hydrolase (beta-lactamase superfamily II)
MEGRGKVKIIRLGVGPLAANTYLLRDEASEAGAVIDPGTEGERIIRSCNKAHLRPLFIINTHGHIDHIGANAALKEAFPDAALCIGTGDAGMLRNAVKNLAVLVGGGSIGPRADVLLEDGRVLEFGSVVLTVMATPGHTPGGICLLARDEVPPQLFCGDLIFHGDVGRTDLPGGSWAEMLASIRQKVFRLPDETVLWPGHGEETTVGEERHHNVYVQSDDSPVP